MLQPAQAVNNPAACCLDAQHDFAQHNYLNALRYYNKALEADSLYLPAYIGRARTCLKLNDCNGAIEDCSLALEIDPHYAPAYIYIGNAYMALNNRWPRRSIITHGHST